MSKATLKQGQQILNLISQSGIELKQLQALIRSGRFTQLLWEFMRDPAQPEPTITPITVPVDYTRTLVEMGDATKCDGCVNTAFIDEHFPVEARESGKRELVLVCFHREIEDDEDPAKSELLRELDRLGLKPEGPPELCAVGEHHPDLQRKFNIVARRQVGRDSCGFLVCPVLDEHDHGRNLCLGTVSEGWHDSCRFLASRK